jgi:hypothetical protein
MSRAEEGFDITESAKVTLDLKVLIGIIAGIVSIAGIWFTLTAKISKLELDILRLEDQTKLNTEFRIQWPRGEMGSLPDDIKQDLKLEYLLQDVKTLENLVKKLEIENAKK